MSAITTIEVKLTQGLTQTREAIAKHDFVAYVSWRNNIILVGIFVGLALVGKQVSREEDEVDKSHNGNDDTHFREFEHVHTVDSVTDENTLFCPIRNGFHLVLMLLQQHTVKHQVGGGTNQRTDTTNDGCITQGYEELGGWQFHLARPVLYHRSKDDDNGGVVEECRDK